MPDFNTNSDDSTPNHGLTPANNPEDKDNSEKILKR